MSTFTFSNKINIIKDFIAPKVCEICGSVIETGIGIFEFICAKCLDRIPLASEPADIYNSLLIRHKGVELALSSVVSLYSLKENHDYIKPIYSLKYFGFSRIGYELGKELGRLLQYYKHTEFDYILPVPIHHARLRERGYNQSEYIAQGISSVVDVPVNAHLIKRNRYTQTQTILSKAERSRNVEKSIAPYSNNLTIEPFSLLLVDDVLTTGSTMNVCAKTLLKMGAGKVGAATIIIAS